MVSFQSVLYFHSHSLFLMYIQYLAGFVLLNFNAFLGILALLVLFVAK